MCVILLMIEIHSITQRTLNYGNYGLFLLMDIMQDLYHQPQFPVKLPGSCNTRLQMAGVQIDTRDMGA